MFMIAPNCPDHGSLVLDLALGRLEDERAGEAERVRDSCPSCNAWWRDRLSGGAVAEVDQAVAKAFEAFRPSGRRRSRLWLAAGDEVVADAVKAVRPQAGRRGRLWLTAGDEDSVDAHKAVRPQAGRRDRLWLAAAAVVLVLAAGLVWRGTQMPSTTTTPSAAELVERAFENGETATADLTGDGVVDAADLVVALHASTPAP